MRRAAILVAAGLLAGCSSGVSLTDASSEDVAKALNGAARQQPGLWETRTALEAMDLGAASDPNAAKLIKAQIGRQQVDSGCLSPQQAASPGFGALRGGRCRFDHFVLEGGKLDAAMHCTRPDAKLSMTQTGSYSATAYDMHSTLRQQAPNRSATWMTIHMAGRRLGACRP